MKLLVLKNSRRLARVSDSDFDLVRHFEWKIDKKGYVYRYRSLADCAPGQKPVTEFLHIFLMGAREGFEIDHKDRCPANCERENLRWATNSQNQSNKPKAAGGTSKYKGVYWEKASGFWRAQISFYRRKTYLGRFSTEQDAARAYDTAARLYFGEFAYLNFP